MTGLLLVKSSIPVIGQIATLLGYIMNGIYWFLDTLFDVQNIGLCIILFTFIMYMLLLPLTIKQQRFSKLSAKMNPEIQAIQKKYKNKKDEASMMKMQDETKAVYEKYGTSPTGGCVQLLIQMPVLLALYQVILYIPGYVGRVADAYMPLVNKIMASDGFQKIMEKIGKASPVSMDPSKYDYSKADTLVSVLYKFQQSTWDTLIDKFPNLTDAIGSTMNQVNHMNNFLGINIAEAPINHLASAAILIPILAGVTQWLNYKLMPTQDTGDNQMAAQMKTMNTVMPIMSVVFCMTLPSGIGLYWIAGAVFRSVQQLVINRHLDKMDVDAIIEKNKEKAAEKEKKRKEKKGAPAAKTVTERAKRNVRNIEEPKKKPKPNEDNADLPIGTSEETPEPDYKEPKPGSLAAKANMVRKFNEGSNK